MEPQSTLLYVKASGAANTKGQDFEWILAGLLFLRLLKSGLKFLLATNVEGADKLDDIVVRFEEKPGKWKTLFVQLKHKEDDSLKWSMLTSKKKNSKFGLPLYFESYLEIKQVMSKESREPLFQGSFEDCQFVIFTNAKAVCKLAEKDVTLREDFSQAEIFLWSGSGSVFSFETDQEMMECLGECGEEGKEFLKQLRLFCGQPSLDDLKAFVKEELAKLYPNTNIERLSECFLNNVKVWWEKSNDKNKQELLHESHKILHKALAEVKSELDSAESRVKPKVELQTSSQQTLKENALPLEFEDSALLKLDDGLVHIVSSEATCRLTLAKLLQSNEGQSLVLTCEQLAANKQALTAECRNRVVNRLVICTKDWHSERCNEYFHVISSMLKIRDTFSIVLVSNGNNNIGSELNDRFQNKGKNYKDNFKTSQLKEESIDVLLNKEVIFQGHDITLGRLFHSANEYLDQELTASLAVEILETNGPLTVGPALIEDIGYFIERTLELPRVYDQVSTFAPRTAMDVEDRLVLVCAEPGMGKSTLMARLAKTTKTECPHYFVILLSLNDHTKLFKESKHEDALEFLAIAANMVSNLERSLLKLALEVTGGVVILSDGFDEIAPKYFEQCCHLLSSFLEKTKVSKIWMTSRNSVKQKIEKHFSKLSATLREFNKAEQKTFFKRLWRETSVLSESELDTFIEHLLDKSSKMFRDKQSNFLGIPLQCQMLAEVFTDLVDGSGRIAKIPDKLDLFSLVELFVDKKFVVYVNNKLQIASHRTDYEDQCEKEKELFIDGNSKAGLLLILGEDELKMLGKGKIKEDALAFCRKIQRGKDKTGFIDEVVNDKPRFIHRVFAEYFVAKWISKHFDGNLEFIQSKIFTPDFTVIRYFFDRTLCKIRDIEILVELWDHQYLCESCAKLNFSENSVIPTLCEDCAPKILCKGCVLHTAVLQENVEEVKTLLESEYVDVEAQDSGGRTALHLAASLGASEDREENKTRCDIVDLIIDNTSDFKVIDKVLRGSPLRYADITRWWTGLDKLLCKTKANGQLVLTLEDVRDGNMLDTIFQQDLDKLLGFCLDNGLEVEHQHGDIEWYRSRRLLVNACCEGAVNVATLLIGRNAEINIILYKDYDIDEGLNNYSGPLIQASIKGHLEIVQLLVEKYISTIASSSHCDVRGGETNHPDASQYINVKVTRGKTAMYYAASKGHTHIINYLKSKGGDPKGREYNETQIHREAREGHTDVLTTLLSQESDAQSRDYFGRTPLHLAAKHNNTDTISALLEGLSEADKFAIINSPDKEGKSVMHHAALESSLDSIELLVKAGGKVNQVDRDKQTPLVSASRAGRLEVVKWLLDNFNEDREGITKVDFINKQNRKGNTAMYYAAKRGSVNSVKLLFEAGGKLNQVDSGGYTLLLAATRKSKHEVVEWLLANFNAEREGITLVVFINIKDKFGYTAMYYAAKRGSVNLVKILFEAGGKLNQVDSYGKTLLMVATENSRHEVVEWLLKNFNEVREGTTLVDFIHKQDKLSNTAMYYAAREGSVNSVKILFEAGGKLNQVGSGGKTLLMVATENSRHEVVEWLKENFNEEREGITLIDFKNIQDNDGNTVREAVVDREPGSGWSCCFGFG